jgi:hypothetical protein
MVNGEWLMEGVYRVICPHPIPDFPLKRAYFKSAQKVDEKQVYVIREANPQPFTFHPST